jgi:hypothetical protein
MVPASRSAQRQRRESAAGGARARPLMLVRVLSWLALLAGSEATPVGDADTR